MELANNELKMRWKEEWSEGVSESVRKLLDPFLTENKTWYKWHKTIYANQVSISNDDLLKEEVGIGVDFRKAMNSTATATNNNNKAQYN